MWRLKQLFFIFLTFLQIFSGANCRAWMNPPLIEPNDAEQVVTAGNKFTIKCRGIIPIQWELPNYTEEDKPKPRPDQHTILDEFDNDSDYQYITTLEVPNMQFYDVGFYSCKYSNKIHENNTLEFMIQEGHAASVYVFVDDPEKLSIPISSYYGYVNQLDTVIIPCRPTMPNVIVTLSKDNNIEVDRFSFDPKFGFSFIASHITDSGQYECQFEKNSKRESETFIVIVAMKTQYIAKPSIQEMGTGFVEEGDTLQLKCTVSVDVGVLFNLHWTIPNFDNNTNIHRIQIATENIERPRQTTQINILTVHNLTAMDEGEYFCYATDSSKNTNHHKRFVHVFPKGKKFIKLTPTNGKTSLEIDTTKPFAQWMITINAHPKPVITWFNNVGNEVTNYDDPGGKYFVNTTSKSSLLKINKLEAADAGVYQVRGMVGGLEEVLNLTVIVNDKPVVYFNDKPLIHIINETTDIDCYVSGFPKPTVEWYFHSCASYPDCTSSETFALQASSETQEKPYLLKSTITITPTQTGNLTCVANNTLGKIEAKRSMFISDVQNGFAVWPLDDQARFVSTVEDDVTLHCGASIYNYSKEIRWFRDDIPVLEDESEGITITTDYNEYSYKSSLHLKNIKLSQTGTYTCEVTKIEDNEDESKEHFSILVNELSAPSISSRRINGSDISLSLGDLLMIDCEASGAPPPIITWYKDDQVIHNTTANNSRIQINVDKHGKSVLTIDKINLTDDGKYSCAAANKVDSDRRTVKLIIKDKPGLQMKYIIIIAVLLLIFLLLIIYLIIKIRNERTLRKELAVAGLAHFEEGALECINPDLGVDDQAELLPYDRKWEFPREKLKLGKQLGSGAFGVVLKADAHGICDEDTTTAVAVKMVKRTADPTFIKALASELKIMVHLGKHLNVVNLLGACTKNVTKRELLVIVEFCRFGNIHNYLLRHRSEFVDQVDPKTDQIDPSIGSEILNRAYSICSNKSRIKIGQLFSTSSAGEQRSELLENSTCATGDSDNSGYLPPIQVDYRVAGSSAAQTAATDITMVSMTPTGDEVMLSNNSIQPEWRSNYRGDYKGNVRPVLTQDLLCWAFQVARGMEYLASRKVLHGDLAARNILLAEDNIVKICDFGLAKSMYKDDNYKKKGDGPLPVKWMAVESIRDRVFSTQSDVWSFGVVLWELFSLARTPYPGMEANEKLYMKLVDGYRMEKPQFANQAVYQIMMDCWRARPPTRPTFTELAESLGNMMEEGVRAHYVDLNNPYLTMNNEVKGQSDYLAMMSAPDFEQLHSPQADHSYVNVTSKIPEAGLWPIRNSMEPCADDSGYLCMSPGNGGTAIFSPRSTASDSSAFKFPPPNNVFSASPTSSQNKSPEMLTGLNNQPRSRQKIVDAEGLIVELTPMLGSNINSDSESEMSPKFNKSASNYQNVNANDLEININKEQTSISNPSYHNLFDKSWNGNNKGSEMPVSPIISKDNYINMPQQKNAFVNSNVDNKPAAFENPSYVTMIPNFDDNKVEHHYVNG